jgi:hypothetical protein
MLIDDPTLIDRYASGIYQIYQQWSSHAQNQRRMLVESLLRAIAATANLPMPQIVWVNAPSSWFRIAQWEIHASLLAIELNPASDFKDWLHKVTSPYHELRHADQHRVLLEAYLTRALPLPLLLSRAVNSTTGHLPSTIQSEGYPYPQWVVARLRMQKYEFQQSWIPQARAWSDSFYGPFSKARQQTMNTLQQHGKAHHYGAYRALAEEADAFAVQTQVKRRLKSLITTVDEDLNLASLFG